MPTDEVVKTSMYVSCVLPPPHLVEGRTHTLLREGAGMAMDRESRWGFVVSVALYLLAALAVLFTGAQRHPWVIILAAVLLLAAAGVANMTVRRVRRQHQLPTWQRTLVPLALTVVAVVLAITFFRAGATDGFGLFCIVGAFITLGHLVGEMRSWTRLRRPIGLVLLVLVTVAVVGGIWVGTTNPTGLYVALGALLAGPVAITLLSADALARDRARPWLWAGVGVALLAAGAVWLAGSIGWYFVVIGGVLLLVLLLAIAADGQADVVLVATLVALVWSAFPRAVPVDADVVATPVSGSTVSDGDRVLVSLGDSYMSGEGAQKFYDGTNTPGGDEPNECRRAPTAYAHLILEDPAAEDFGSRLAFFACSGAVGSHLWRTPQYAGEPPGGDPATQLQQLAALREAGAEVPLVLVSIGGNDAGFADLAIACIAPGNCVQRGDQWLRRLQDVAERLDTAYDEIRRSVGDDVPVVVVPYPQPINAVRKNCGYSLLESQEHRFLNGFVTQLDNVVKKAARQHGFYYLDAMKTVLEDAQMRICDTGSNQDALGVNFLAISDTEGLIDQLANPMGWLHNSLHPNERGHVEMTKVLAAWMGSHPSPRGLSDEAGSEVYDVATLQSVMGESFDGKFCGQPGFDTDRCALSDAEWTVTEVSLFLSSVLLPVGLMVLGAWLVALGLLRLVRPYSRRFFGRVSDWLFGVLGRIGPGRPGEG